MRHDAWDILAAPMTGTRRIRHLTSQKEGARMSRRHNKIVLAAGITVALITAMAGSASARASAIGQAGTPVPVDVTGDITWTLDRTPATPPGATGTDVQTGLFHIGLTDVTNYGTAVGGNSSTYSITDSTNYTVTDSRGCNDNVTGTFSGSGPLPYQPVGHYTGNTSLNFGIGIPTPDIPVGVRIFIAYVESFSNASDCGGTATAPTPQVTSPACITSDGFPNGLGGTFQGTYPNGTVNLGCSGTFAGRIGSGSFSINGTLSITPAQVPVPIAAFTTKDSGTTIGDAGTVTFDGNGSQPAGSPLTTYTWDFGDGTQQTTTSSTVVHRYTHIKQYTASLVVTDALGDSSHPVSQTFTPGGCNGETSAAVTLPPVDESYSNLIKLIRFLFGALPLTFGSISSPLGGLPADSLCSWQATGTLPMTIALGPLVGPSVDLTVGVIASATLDFLTPGSPALPDCNWTTIKTACVIGGSGDAIVRWHTNGFRVITGLPFTLPASPAFTYYERVPSTDTYAQAIQAVEPDIHVTLTQHLGWINTLYMIQEPPADVAVTDSMGNVTGVNQAGAQPLQQIPGSIYVTNGQGYSAVLLFQPAGAYTVTAVGSSGSPYSLSLSKIDPFNVDPSQTTDVRITGTLTNSGQASVCYDALQGCQSQFIFQGYTLPPSAAAGNAVPIRIGVGDASGSPATGLAPLLYLAPVQAGIVGTFVPATSVGKANQGNMFRKIAPGQYMYNLDTKSLTPGTWVLRTRLPDGGTYTSSFVVQ
jgi:hypothetical protein